MRLSKSFLIIKTLKAIDDAHVVILVLDARQGVVDQDLHLIGFVLDAGRSLVVAVNKWDGMDPEDRAKVKEQVKRRLDFLIMPDKALYFGAYGSGWALCMSSVEAVVTNFGDAQAARTNRPYNHS